MEKKVHIEEPINIAGVKLTLISEVSIKHLAGKGHVYFQGAKKPVAVVGNLTGSGLEIVCFEDGSFGLDGNAPPGSLVYHFSR